MSRIQRVKDAIAYTLHKIEVQIKTIHDQGGTAPEGIIGFRNGLALADHHINMRPGEVQMIDLDQRRKSRIGKVEPAVEVAEADEQEYEYLVDRIIAQARAVCWTEEPAEEIKVLGHKIGELDEFVSEKLSATMDSAGTDESLDAPDAGSEAQESSSLSPAAFSPTSAEFNGA